MMDIINHINFEKNPLKIMEQAISTGDIQKVSMPKGNVMIMSEEEFYLRLNKEIQVETDENEVRITRQDLGI